MRVARATEEHLPDEAIERPELTDPQGTCDSGSPRTAGEGARRDAGRRDEGRQIRGVQPRAARRLRHLRGTLRRDVC